MAHVETARLLAENLFGGAGPEMPETVFPSETWKRFGDEGLLGLSTPEAYGGSGIDAPQLFRIGEALVDGGCSLGVALSWLVHNLTAQHVLAEHAGNGQRECHLSALAEGRSSLALAVSEPDMHGSPKRLEAKAIKADGGYRLSGEKIYLTNGPIADLFVVVAVEGEEGGRKSFGAFLVGKDEAGVTVETMELDSLQPSPHARLILKDCWVPDQNRLNPTGDAFESMVKPFGFFERVLLLGPTLGAMKRLTSVIADRLAAEQQQGDDVAEKLGHVALLCNEVDVLGERAAQIVEKEAGHLSPLPASMAAWAACRSFVERYMALIDQTGHGADASLSRVLHDMDQLCRLAEGAQKHGFIRLGRNLMGSEG